MKTENARIGSESQDAMTSIYPQRVRFGPFEADLETHELWKNGIKVKLGGQPFEILAVLLNRPGQLVTREELQKEIWAADTFVDFNHGLNAAVNKLRETLSDSAEEPKYIETLPRRGYRFIGRIENAVSELKPEGAKPGPRVFVALPPPMPTPVKNRNRLSTLSDPTTALSNEAMPKSVRLPSNSGRRSNRSPIGPAESAPTMMPILDHRNAMANVDGGKCHSWISDGTAQATELRS